MDGRYDVTWNGQTVGTVEVKQEGLYCRITCRCRMVDTQIHRLYADGENIGVLAPKNGELMLEAKVAAKRMKSGCTFSLDEKQGNFIPIRPGEKFPCLDKLRHGGLIISNGEPGLCLE